MSSDHLSNAPKILSSFYVDFRSASMKERIARANRNLPVMPKLPSQSGVMNFPPDINRINVP
jgi:hypothetical protein